MYNVYHTLTATSLLQSVDRYTVALTRRDVRLRTIDAKTWQERFESQLYEVDAERFSVTRLRARCTWHSGRTLAEERVSRTSHSSGIPWRQVKPALDLLEVSCVNMLRLPVPPLFDMQISPVRRNKRVAAAALAFTKRGNATLCRCLRVSLVAHRFYCFTSVFTDVIINHL